MVQLTLTLKMITAQVVETSATVNNNGPIQDYVHPDDQTQPTFVICFVKVTTLPLPTHSLSSNALKINKHPGGLYRGFMVKEKSI